jgi:hypothetical protein
METGHRPQRPDECDGVQRHPVIFSRHHEYRRICPEQEWRLAIHRVDVGPASIYDLVCHDGVRRFIIDGLRMLK